MNLAEKAKKAREAQEKQKRERKENFVNNLVKYLIIILVAAAAVVTVGVVWCAEVKDMESLALWSKFAIGVLIACIGGGVISFFFGGEKAGDWTALMVCIVCFLALMTWGFSGMLNGQNG